MPVDDDLAIRQLLKEARTIAVVGASEKTWRDSHRIASFLIQKGYEVYPVNPRYQTVLGLKCYPDLAALPEPADIVDVFRRSEAVPEVVDAAVATNAKALWLQLGVIHEAAAQKAEQSGILVVMDRCILVDHQRLMR